MAGIEFRPISTAGIRRANKALFESFEGERDAWDAKVGLKLTYERLHDRRASRIAHYHDPVDLSGDMSQDDRQEVVDWGVQSLLAMFDAMNPTLRTKAKALRDEASAAPASPSSADDSPE